MTPAARLLDLRSFGLRYLAARRFWGCWGNDVRRIHFVAVGCRSGTGAIPHPSCAVIFCRPSEQASRKTFLRYVPLCAVLIFVQPGRNLLRCLLMVNFGDDQWPLTRKEACAAT